MPVPCCYQLEKSIMELRKAYQSSSGKWKIFLAYLKLCVQQPYFGKRKLKEREQRDAWVGSSVNNAVYVL